MSNYDLGAMGAWFDEEMFNAGAVEAPADYLDGGSEFRYVQGLWLNGLKNYIMIFDPAGTYKTPMGNFKKSRNTAVGLHFEVAKMSDSMLKAAQRMAQPKSKDWTQEPTGEFIHAIHDDGRIKEYFHILTPRFYILTHGAPSAGSIMFYRDNEWQYSQSKLLGMAAGSWTTYKKEEKKQNTSNFVSFLAVEQNLLASGYVDKETGLPGVVVIKMGSLNSKVMFKALMAHFSFILNQRKRVAADLLARGIVRSKPAAEFFARMRVQFWSYGMDLYEGVDTVEHKGANGKQDVFEPYNHSEDAYGSLETGESLYCGDANFKALMAWVYEDVTARTPVLGGPAIEWCRQTVENAIKNQREWNPQGKLEFGTHDAPPWMINRAVKSKTSFEDPEEADAAPTSRSTGNGSTGPDAKARQHAALTRMLETNNEFFAEKGDQEGMEIYDDLIMSFLDAQTIEEQLPLLVKAKAASAARREKLGGVTF